MLALGAIILGQGCGSSDITGATPAPEMKLAVTSAPSATSADRTAFATQPVVQLQNADGTAAAVAGAVVTAAVTSGGGTLLGTTSATTNSSGAATFTDLSIGGLVGGKTITFRSDGADSATAGVTLTSGAATTIAVNAGNNQTAALGTVVSTPPSVKVTDADGNPVSGVGVTFAVSGGGGSVTGASQSTNAFGIAAVGSWTLGTLSFLSNTLTATAVGLSGSPVRFFASGTTVPAGAATTIAIDFGDSQVAAVGTAVATPPTVVVTDANGRGVPGVTVTFAVASGGGTITGATPQTSGGFATVGSWTLGPNPGTNTLTASVPGLSGSPVTITATGVAASFTGTSISAAVRHSCAVASSGATYCWGYDFDGELGDGTANSVKASRVLVTGGIAFTSVTTGYDFSCGLTGAGAAYCWGVNSNGQLGDGTVSNRTSPVAVSGGLTFQSISAGGIHACGLTTAGKVFCWGNNINDQVGDGTTTDRSTPTQILSALTFKTVSAGGLHSCALATDGTAYCWGYNANGELGDGTTTNRSTPVAVSTSLVFQSISASKTAAFSNTPGFSCALTPAGSALCWGYNGDGELGNGSTTNRTTPGSISGGITFSGLDAGGQHACGWTSSGATYCWGLNNDGQLGDGTATSRSVPTPVAGGLTFKLVSAGTEHTCALATDGTVNCWGDNFDGQLGDGTETNRSAPISPISALKGSLNRLVPTRRSARSH